MRGSLTSPTRSVVEKEINTDFPLALNIEPTNDCNLRCRVCPRNLGKREVGYMDFNLYKKIVDEAAGRKKLKMLNFHKDGESTLHPMLFDMIRHAKEKDIANVIHMNTNAVLLSEKYAGRLMDTGIDDITISLDAFKKETYKKIKGSDCFDIVENNIVRFFNLRSKKGLDKPFTRIKIMWYEDTKDDIEPFIEKWRPIADDVQVSAVHTWGDAIKNITTTYNKPRKRYPCILLWYMMAVNWDGSVSICNIDWNLTGKIGSVRENSLHNIWNSHRMKEIRKEHLNGNFSFVEVCDGCNVWTEAEDMGESLSRKKEFYE